VDDTRTTRRTTLFGPLPTRGIWTALGLTRGQFLFILGGSVALFLFVSGPLWQHLHESHFARIVLSYAVIPFAVAAALYRNGGARAVPILIATIVIALLKLVVTAAVLVVIGMAQT
jgi:hypothetical protein